MDILSRSAFLGLNVGFWCFALPFGMLLICVEIVDHYKEKLNKKTKEDKQYLDKLLVERLKEKLK